MGKENTKSKSLPLTSASVPSSAGLKPALKSPAATKDSDSMQRFKHHVRKGIKVEKKINGSTFSLYKSQSRVMLMDQDFNKLVLKKPNTESGSITVAVLSITSIADDEKHPLRMRVSAAAATSAASRRSSSSILRISTQSGP